MIVAVPSIMLAMLFLAVAVDPVRASMDGGGGLYNEEISWKKVKAICASRSNRLMFAQGIPGCMPWG